MATSPITVLVSVHSNALITDPSGSGLKTNARIEDTRSYATTTLPAQYTADADGIATDVYNWINGLTSTNIPAAQTTTGVSYTGLGTSVGAPAGSASTVATTVSFVQAEFLVANIVEPQYWDSGRATPVAAIAPTASPNAAPLVPLATPVIPTVTNATSRIRYTQFRAGTATPASDAVSYVNRGYRQSLALGPADYSNQASIKAILLAQLVKAQVNSGYA